LGKKSSSAQGSDSVFSSPVRIFGDLAMQDDAADQLHVEVAHG
jgi:hypothetical protein